jgi:hypothetical protein
MTDIVQQLRDRNDDLCHLAAVELENALSQNALLRQMFEQEKRISDHRKAQIEHLKDQLGDTDNTEGSPELREDSQSELPGSSGSVEEASGPVSVDEKPSIA